ncbi:hypothetical protein F4677DRAFT_266431 [Hypoxylon crocopeplum]|nr:hypothetical protein F4677DRAFT_266431 [Hypoxylon crocopeplum]
MSQQPIQPPAQSHFQQLVQQPAQQVIPQPVQPPRDYFQRTQVTLIEKTPFESRANPFVDKGHPDFLRMEKYFLSLLRNTSLTISQILDKTFEPHEIRLFEPANRPPELVKLQKDNAIRYHKLLQTRFKDHVPSLQLKMAFLYFGLPVAPMKPGGSQDHLLMDLDVDEDTITFETDPLKFLDYYEERSYGDPDKRVFEPLFPENPPIQVFSSMNLRGGALPAVASRSTATGVGVSVEEHKPVRVYGYQGSISTDTGYENLVAAIDQVLGVKSKYNYVICLEVWNTSTPTTAPVGQANGMVYHLNTKPESNDPLVSLIRHWFNRSTESNNYSCFVHFDMEKHPTFYQPADGLDRYVIRVWDDAKKNMAYMKTPGNIGSTHKANQIDYDYVRALQTLFPQFPHAYLQFLSGAEGLTYGLLDPPPEVWKKMAKEFTKGGQLPLLSFNTINIPNDYIPILIPGYYKYKTDFQSSRSTSSNRPTTLKLKDLQTDRTNGDRVGLEIILDSLTVAYPHAMRSIQKIGIDVWLPGHDFINHTIEPCRIDIVNTEIGLKTISDWRFAIHRFQMPRVHSTFQNLSVVARPVFQTYRIHTNQGGTARQVSIDINRNTLDDFVAAVHNALFPNYSGEEGDFLHLVQSTWGTNKMDFVFTNDTTEAEWKWIVRHITEPDITVTIENWTSHWFIDDDKTTWGPRYDNMNATKLSSRFESPVRPHTFSQPMNHLFRNSGNTFGDAGRVKVLRDRFFWDTPKIFTNPTKPAFPILAAPVETIIRTGDDVPGFTTAMRTPGEVARLEREVHTLRGNLLDRIRECPYIDCPRYFPFSDAVGLDQHLREDHTTLRCFLCVKEKHLLPYYDSGAIRQHFLEEHYDEIVSSGTPGGSRLNKAKPRHCNRCGRNLAKLYNPKDQENHDRLCKIGEKTLKEWCMLCGKVINNPQAGCQCGLTLRDFFDPGNYCGTCGLGYDINMNVAYRTNHRNHCRRPGGSEDDCCYNCGIVLVDKSWSEKQRHISSCAETSRNGFWRSSGLQDDIHETSIKNRDDISQAPIKNPERPSDTIPDIIGALGTGTKRRRSRASRKRAEKDGTKSKKNDKIEKDKKKSKEGERKNEKVDQPIHSGFGISSWNSGAISKDGPSRPFDNKSGPGSTPNVTIKPFWDSDSDVSMTNSGESVSQQETLGKRKRPAVNDPWYAKPINTESKLEEEYSEVSAESDPIDNLEPDAPRTPAKRSSSKKPSRAKEAVEEASSAAAESEFEEVGSDYNPDLEDLFAHPENYARPVMSLPPDMERMRQVARESKERELAFERQIAERVAARQSSSWRTSSAPFRTEPTPFGTESTLFTSTQPTTSGSNLFGTPSTSVLFGEPPVSGTTSTSLFATSNPFTRPTISDPFDLESSTSWQGSSISSSRVSTPAPPSTAQTQTTTATRPTSRRSGRTTTTRTPAAGSGSTRRASSGSGSGSGSGSKSGDSWQSTYESDGADLDDATRAAYENRRRSASRRGRSANRGGRRYRQADYQPSDVVDIPIAASATGESEGSTTGEGETPTTGESEERPATTGESERPTTAGETEASATAEETEASATAEETEASATAEETEASATAEETEAPVTPKETEAPVTPKETEAPVTPEETEAPATGESEAPATRSRTRAQARAAASREAGSEGGQE